MKKMVTDTMLMPAYAARFACIGGDCEDTCCAGWSIALDKGSFQHYQACFDPVLRPLFSKHVKRYAKSKSSNDYGHIELVKDECRNCGLLSDRRLCLIQERLGEGALCDTCAYYPRATHLIGDLHQMTLSLSCPEAARQALLVEDAFDFVGQEQTVSLDRIICVSPQAGLSLAAMDEVRTLLFQILRSPDITLNQRLRLIGGFCDRLTALLERKDPRALPGLLREMEADLDSGAAMAPLAGLPDLPDVQAQIASAFFRMGRGVARSPHVHKVLEEAARGLGFEGGQIPEGATLVSAYKAGLERLAPALEAVPWLLEHFLLNEFLREIFPWSEGSPRRHHAILVIRFATARLILAGRAAACEATLSPVELAETLQVYCRRYTHDESLTRKAEQALAKIGWDGFERLCALV